MESIKNICKILRVLERALDKNGATLSYIRFRHNFETPYTENILQIMTEGKIAECYWDDERSDFVYRITLAGLEFMVKYEEEY